MQRGTTVEDAITGEVVATRTAEEKDDNGDRRVIQLVDISGRQATLEVVRGGDSMVSTDDSPAIGSIPAEFADRRLWVGDATTLVAQVVHGQSDGRVNLTPIVTMQAVNSDYESVSGGELIGVQVRDIELTHTAYPADGTAATRTSDAFFGEYLSGDDHKHNRLVIPFTNVNIPPCASVFNATLSLYFLASYGGQFAENAMIWVFDSSAMAPYFVATTDAARWAALEAILLPDNGVEWDSRYDPDEDPVSNGQWNTTPDISGPIQEIVSGSQWSRDDQLWVVISNSAHGIDGGITSIDRTTNLPEIEITHDGGSDYYGVLETKTTGMGSQAIYLFDGAVNNYLSPVLSWDLKGAKQVNLHISGLSTSNEVRVLAGVI